MARIKLYTVDEAERTLPLVKRIIRDVKDNFAEHEARLLKRKKLPLTPPHGSSIEEEAFHLESEMEHYASEVARFQHELEQLGIEVKDYRSGLLDFYSRYDNRLVYLCWKSDEGDALGFWHDLQSGFLGRQPITPANRLRFKGLSPGQKFIEIA